MVLNGTIACEIHPDSSSRGDGFTRAQEAFRDERRENEDAHEDRGHVVNLFELTRMLVDIESITGQEKACAEFLHDYLKERHFKIERQSVESKRWNVFAYHGQPKVILSTHMDTVPPFLPADEDSEFIYGRGACDAKGSLACQLTAAEQLLHEGIEDVGLLFLVGEETISDGARVANLSFPETQYIIVGEPTNNKLVIAAKGVLHIVLRTRGRMAHSAYPESGESAIVSMLDLLADLQAVAFHSHPVLGPVTMNIGTISGGRAANIVPDEATAQILYRTVENSGELRQTIESLLQGRCQYEVVRTTPAVTLQHLNGFDSDIVAYSTDVPNLTRWGRPLLLGPGSVEVAHTDHECVRKTELLQAVDLYCRMVRELRSRAQSEHGAA